MDFDVIIEWFQTNLGLVFTWTGFTALIGTLSIYITTKLVPSILAKLQETFAVVISNLFGKKYGGDADLVGELPIMDQAKDWGTNLSAQTELWMIDLKKQTISPLYSDAEKVKIQAFYDKLYTQMEGKLSQEAKDLLALYDNKEV